MPRRRESGRATGDLFRATEIDARLVGMLAALALIWVGVDVLSGGAFLTPRNLWNLSVQTASVAVMAAGMVLVIVARHIDLSVGSILGFVGMMMGVMQAEFLPSTWASIIRSSGPSHLPRALPSVPRSGCCMVPSSPTSACRPSS